jgi:hypothetical protein
MLLYVPHLSFSILENTVIFKTYNIAPVMFIIIILNKEKYLRNGVDHVKSHLYGIPGVVAAGLRQA